jgi:similar to stage IV sporulation protein
MERPALCAGALICLLLILNIQNYVASISFIGDANNEVCNKITQELYECGVKKGANFKRIDLVAARNQCLSNIPDVIFMGINRVGMDIIVEAIQRPFVPQMQYRGVPCNIISSRDCIIHEMSVLSGHPLVKVGDTVKKGQLLVSGIIPTKKGEGEPIYARSIANIDARVFYSATEEALKYTPISERTGKKKRGFEIKFSEYGIIDFNVEDFTHSEVESRKVNLLPGILPFYAIIDEYHELKVKALPKDIDTVYNEAKLKAQAKAASKVPGYAEIVDIKVFYNEYDSRVQASAYIECIEPVAVQIPLN